MACVGGECSVVVELEGRDDHMVRFAQMPETVAGFKAAIWGQLGLEGDMDEWGWRAKGQKLGGDDAALAGLVTPGDRVVLMALPLRVEREKLAAEGVTKANVDEALEGAVARRDFRLLQRAMAAGLPSLSFLHKLLLDAAARDAVDLVSVLIESEAVSPDGLQSNADAKDVPISVAADCGYLSTLQLLIESGADPNRLDSRDSTPLMRAAAAGRLPCVEYLCQAGAQINYQTVRGTTALCLAAQQNHDDVVQFLVAAGADTDVRDFWSRMSPLHHATDNGDKRSVEVLASRRRSLNARNRAGETPLIVAIANGDYETAKLLLKHKPDVEVKDSDGRTALFHAAAEGRMDLVKALVEECHADVHAASNFGMTPLLVAEEEENEEVLQYLQSAAGAAEM